VDLWSDKKSFFLCEELNDVLFGPLMISRILNTLGFKVYNGLVSNCKENFIIGIIFNAY
jgi:hypothetical protein